jgi:hypothetical protein
MRTHIKLTARNSLRSEPARDVAGHFGYSHRTQQLSRRPPARPEPFQPSSVWRATRAGEAQQLRGDSMNGLIYLIGLIVVIMAILSLFGLR